MSEETQYWGIAVEAYDQSGRPASKLLTAPGTAPGRKPFPVYPVFSSRERADKFVREQGPTLGQDLVEETRLSQELVEETRANIRQIKRDEIPDAHDVSLDGAYPETWAEHVKVDQK